MNICSYFENSYECSKFYHVNFLIPIHKKIASTNNKIKNLQHMQCKYLIEILHQC